MILRNLKLWWGCDERTIAAGEHLIADTGFDISEYAAWVGAVAMSDYEPTRVCDIGTQAAENDALFPSPVSDYAEELLAIGYAGVAGPGRGDVVPMFMRTADGYLAYMSRRHWRGVFEALTRRSPGAWERFWEQLQAGTQFPLFFRQAVERSHKWWAYGDAPDFFRKERAARERRIQEQPLPGSVAWGVS